MKRQEHFSLTFDLQLCISSVRIVYAGIILNIMGPPVEHNDFWWHILGNGIYIAST